MLLPQPPPTDRVPTLPSRKSWLRRLGDWASRRPWRFAAAFTLAVVVVFSFLPVWQTWWFSDWEGLGLPGSLWSMFASMPRAAEQVGIRDVLLRYYGDSLLFLVVLFVVSLGFGRWLGGRL